MKLGFGFDITVQICKQPRPPTPTPLGLDCCKLLGAPPNAYTMSADLQDMEQDDTRPRVGAAQPPQPAPAADSDLEDEEDEEEDEDEPKLKYAKLTGSLTNVYRNGDSTSAFVVAGDKMALGTHNGNIHVLQLPTMKSLRTYHAHSATITSLSISPTPPAPTAGSIPTSNPGSVSSPPPPPRQSTTSNTSTFKTRPQQTQSQQPSIPNTPNNNIYIATSSLDGHVCVSSLLDPKDVQLRNFARPVSTVALSPHYKTDRTYLSGGLGGQLILTVGGRSGVTIDANTNSAAAAASGWLGSIGLGQERGKDEVLHQGEGGIKEIKFSNSGKWVVWVNEEGVKIMRSHLRLGSEESEDAWRRIAHAARPNRREWEEFAVVWRGRCEWVDERKLEEDDEVEEEGKGEVVLNGTGEHGTSEKKKREKKVEKLIVGWGDTAYILHVTEERTTSAATGRREVGKAELMRKMQFRDCIISGIGFYTPSLLAILAYRTLDDDDKPVGQPKNHSSASTTKRAKHRHTGLEPQLRLVDMSGDEMTVDELSISRFETLSAQDYHLSTLWIPPAPPKPSTTDKEKGALEGIWDAAGGKYANRLFSSSASILSHGSSGENSGAVSSPPSSAVNVAITPKKKVSADVAAHPYLLSSGLKVFIQSPYDCVLAVKTDLSDRLKWLMEREKYEEAWKLVDAHPEVVSATSSTEKEKGSRPSTPSGKGGSLADFFADDAASLHSSEQQTRTIEREKLRIGERWLQQLISSSRYEEAGRVAGKVLGNSPRWERWVWAFREADKFDEISPFIPFSSDTGVPGDVYVVVLGHYVVHDPERLRQLLGEWDPGMGVYDTESVASATKARLRNEDGEGVKEGGEEWRVLTECLAKLYLAEGRVREALKCYIRTQNAESAFRLLTEEGKVLDGIDEEDIPGLLLLRIPLELMKSGSLKDLDEASTEAVALLVEEGLRGTLLPRSVISVLEKKGPKFNPFLYFYLRGLWNGTTTHSSTAPRLLKSKFDPRGDVDEGHALVEDHADLAVELFVEYDRPLLMEFLRASSVYSFDKAASLCEARGYYEELVHIYSKTGQNQRALHLIIDELGDVSKAIQLATENPDLWDDLLKYSMDAEVPKPAFIRGLLEEVGTAIDPIELIKCIPEGVEIPGLKQGVQKLMREYDIQVDLSEGVARVLRGEVSAGMETLRAGRAKGVRFEVVHDSPSEVEVSTKDPPTQLADGEALPLPATKVSTSTAQPGHCVGCGDPFHEDEKETLLGFACGHVYHLSCLLRANPETNDEETIERLWSQLGTGEGGEEGYSGRSVGAKVAHAHIIRSVVKGGCQHCIRVEDSS